MTEKYIDLVSRITEDFPPQMGPDIATLRWLDEHPDQVPGRTITESEFDRVSGTFPAGGPRLDLRNALIRFGFAFVEDREPTNAERWDALVEKWHETQDANPAGLTFGEWLDAAGVKAPEGGGNDD